MKHGNKKGKAKATAPGKKSKAAAKSKTASRVAAKAAGPKASPARGAPKTDGVAFNNPAVAAAFKRAVKKYPGAFRRLTD